MKTPQDLIGKQIGIFTLGTINPILETIKGIKITPENFTHRFIYFALYDENTFNDYDKIPFEKLNEFLNGEQIELKDSKDESFIIELDTMGLSKKQKTMKYYYLAIGNVIKEVKLLNFHKILGYNSEGVLTNEHTEIKGRANREYTIPFGEIISLMEQKKFTIEGYEVGEVTGLSIPKDLIYETDRDAFLLKMEIENIILTENEKLELSVLKSELSQVKSEADLLLADVGRVKKSAKDTIAGMEAMSEAEKDAQKFKKGELVGLDANGPFDREVIGTRRMFGSKIQAVNTKYMGKDPKVKDKTGEYSATQLYKQKNKKYSNPHSNPNL